MFIMQILFLQPNIAMISAFLVLISSPISLTFSHLLVYYFLSSLLMIFFHINFFSLLLLFLLFLFFHFLHFYICSFFLFFLFNFFFIFIFIFILFCFSFLFFIFVSVFIFVFRATEFQLILQNVTRSMSNEFGEKGILKDIK